MKEATKHEDLLLDLHKAVFEILHNYKWRPHQKREVSAEDIDNLRDAYLAIVSNVPRGIQPNESDFDMLNRFGLTPGDVDKAITSYFEKL